MANPQMNTLGVIQYPYFLIMFLPTPHAPSTTDRRNFCLATYLSPTQPLGTSSLFGNGHVGIGMITAGSIC